MGYLKQKRGWVASACVHFLYYYRFDAALSRRIFNIVKRCKKTSLLLSSFTSLKNDVTGAHYSLHSCTWRVSWGARANMFHTRRPIVRPSLSDVRCRICLMDNGAPKRSIDCKELSFALGTLKAPSISSPPITLTTQNVGPVSWISYSPLLLLRKLPSSTAAATELSTGTPTSTAVLFTFFVFRTNHRNCKEWRTPITTAAPKWCCRFLFLCCIAELPPKRCLASRFLH